MGMSVNDEIIPARFSIRLIEQNIIAMLTVLPGRQIRRRAVRIGSGRTDRTL